MQTVIETKNLGKHFEHFDLKKINLIVTKGVVVGLIGENGAGKTTLLRLLLDQIQKSSGNIRLFGQDISQQLTDQSYKEDIGFVLDECCFHKYLTAAQIDKVMVGIYKNWDSKQFHLLLQRFGIDLRKKIGEYSKGMKNKIMLAAALSHSPKLLILDEVTSGLDPVAREEILSILKEYVRENKTTLLFSTHITTDIEKIADEVAFLHQGILVFQAPLNELLHKYLLLKCSENEWKHTNAENVIISVRRNGTVYGLLHNNEKMKTMYPDSVFPSLEDIMLMHIKGGKRFAGTN